jgi:hypothetical protein
MAPSEPWSTSVAVRRRQSIIARGTHLSRRSLNGLGGCLSLFVPCGRLCLPIRQPFGRLVTALSMRLVVLSMMFWMAGLMLLLCCRGTYMGGSSVSGCITMAMPTKKTVVLNIHFYTCRSIINQPATMRYASRVSVNGPSDSSGRPVHHPGVSFELLSLSCSTTACRACDN